MRSSHLFAVLLAILASPFALAKPALKIYLDADRTHHSESALSIEQGFKTAFAQVDNSLQGYPIEFINLNHRANAARSYKHMQTFANDPQAIAFVAGLHSTPLLKYRDYINQNKLLTLVPWAAGGPITRSENDENWIFRLSVDDSKVGGFLVDYALETKHCKRPQLLLESTAWGESNAKNMSAALKAMNKPEPTISWFQWGLDQTDARIILRNIVNNNSDCILLVANAAEGEVIIRAMSTLEAELRLPIISHWGITGGSFTDKVTAAEREKVDLSFVQSCFSFMQPQLDEFASDVFQAARQQFTQIDTPKDIKAPVGFIHGYDLAKVFIAAANQIELSDSKADNQLALAQALENLEQPVQGLIKNYQQPFETYSLDKPDAHEALSQQDYCIAYFNASGDTLVQSKD